MSDQADHLPTAFRHSADILQEVRRAEALLRATFDAACLDRNGLLAQPDRCSDALTDAIRALLDAQKRLVETEWPQFSNEPAAYQPVHMVEDAAA